MSQDLNSAANQFFSRREAMRPTARTWAKHIGLLLVTFCTVTIAGLLPPFGIKYDIFSGLNPQTWTETLYALLSLPAAYVQELFQVVGLLFTSSEYRAYGLSFSFSLLFILTSHEMGHYVACRLYGVDATLPFFIPTPPLVGPAGTFGAFIKIVSPLPSRRATFDIGVAGPIAGFVALIPIAVIGFLTLQPAPPVPNVEGGQIVFSNPLFFHLLSAVFGAGSELRQHSPNPFYAAAWLGMLVTSLNLIPSGQLDGGHAVYSVFGERLHRWTGRIAFAAMIVLSISGLYFYNSPSGILFAVLLGVMMRIRHPEPLDTTPLDAPRRFVAILTLLIFVLSFTPFPIQIQ
ncbi:MAG TPA: site-2 protease family protein [Pyrinomonadaceae bacterium]|jgi:membrane-associated protease RseP (regulator of RpoE activity)